MRLWRYLVLVAALLGVGAFFAPFFEYRAPDGSLTGATPYEIVAKTFDARPLMTGAEKVGLVSHAEAARITQMVAKVMAAYRTALIAAFVPVAALLLAALGCFARRAMGRLTGLFALVCGIACVAVYVFVFDIASPSRTTTGQLGLGIYLLLVCGLASTLGGLGAVVLPDRDG